MVTGSRSGWSSLECCTKTKLNQHRKAKSPARTRTSRQTSPREKLRAKLSCPVRNFQKPQRPVPQTWESCWHQPLDRRCWGDKNNETCATIHGQRSTTQPLTLNLFPTPPSPPIISGGKPAAKQEWCSFLTYLPGVRMDNVHVNGSTCKRRQDVLILDRITAPVTSLS